MNKPSKEAMAEIAEAMEQVHAAMRKVGDLADKYEIEVALTFDQDQEIYPRIYYRPLSIAKAHWEESNDDPNMTFEVATETWNGYDIQREGEWRSSSTDC